MHIKATTKALSALGGRLRAFAEGQQDQTLQSAVDAAGRSNAWFTAEEVMKALSWWGSLLREENIRRWVAPYAGRIADVRRKTVAAVLPGNIPLAGFHDVVSVLMAGHRLLYKMSSGDRHLVPALLRVLEEGGCRRDAEEAGGTVKGFDAVIATGGDNTSRYFRHYFAGYPHIIRGNRNGAALLTGGESSAELAALGGDVFRYFGLGCRSVSKLFVPVQYDFTSLLAAFAPYARTLEHNKYRNNYDYQKALLLMNRVAHHDAGFLLIREDRQTATPVSVLNYEYYRGPGELKKRLNELSGALQCIVSSGRDALPGIPFGTAQSPELWDYADGLDTMDFLRGL